MHLSFVESGSPDGAPVLLIAPGGMRSADAVWGRVGFHPADWLPELRVVSMDQRNAGDSTGPIEPDHGWATYTRDQLALLDHLGIDRFHVIGMCIGGPYALGLAAAAPERVISAVLLQPIGLADNRDAFYELFDSWAAELVPTHLEADDATWARFREAMFGGDFVFGVTREQVAACPCPLLVLRGDDLYHPSATSEEIARLAPRAELVERWKEPELQEATVERIRGFLGL